MIRPEVLDAMVAAGCTAEQIVAAVKAEAQAENARTERKREVDAARKRRQRANVTQSHADIAGQDGTTRDTLPPKEKSPEPSKEITPNPQTPSPPKGGSFPAGFDRFWDLYPNKVGKPVAAKKFGAALKVASFETIMAGLAAYVAKTDDRPWCNPSTWLHQQRWADQPSEVARGSPPRQAATGSHHFTRLAEELIDEPERTFRSDQGHRDDVGGFPVLTISDYRRHG